MTPNLDCYRVRAGFRVLASGRRGLGVWVRGCVVWVQIFDLEFRDQRAEVCPVTNRDLRFLKLEGLGGRFRV